MCLELCAGRLESVGFPDLEILTRDENRQALAKPGVVVNDERAEPIHIFHDSGCKGSCIVYGAAFSSTQ